MPVSTYFWPSGMTVPRGTLLMGPHYGAIGSYPVNPRHPCIIYIVFFQVSLWVNQPLVIFQRFLFYLFYKKCIKTPHFVTGYQDAMAVPYLLFPSLLHLVSIICYIVPTILNNDSMQNSCSYHVINSLHCLTILSFPKPFTYLSKFSSAKWSCTPRWTLPLASYFWQEAIVLIGYHPRLECSLSVLLLLYFVRSKSSRFDSNFTNPSTFPFVIIQVRTCPQNQDRPDGIIDMTNTPDNLKFLGRAFLKEINYIIPTVHNSGSSNHLHQALQRVLFPRSVLCILQHFHPQKADVPQLWKRIRAVRVTERCLTILGFCHDLRICQPTTCAWRNLVPGNVSQESQKVPW